MDMSITLRDVEERVEDIRRRAGDDEAAHSREDALYRDVLESIAMGGGEWAPIAAAVLRTSEIEFDRWYA
jgi:hypothetical protein